jgi:hypothetical protein
VALGAGDGDDVTALARRQRICASLGLGQHGLGKGGRSDRAGEQESHGQTFLVRFSAIE